VLHPKTQEPLFLSFIFRCLSLYTQNVGPVYSYFVAQHMCSYVTENNSVHDVVLQFPGMSS